MTLSLSRLTLPHSLTPPSLSPYPPTLYYLTMPTFSLSLSHSAHSLLHLSLFQSLTRHSFSLTFFSLLSLSPPFPCYLSSHSPHTFSTQSPNYLPHSFPTHSPYSLSSLTSTFSTLSPHPPPHSFPLPSPLLTHSPYSLISLSPHYLFTLSPHAPHSLPSSLSPLSLITFPTHSPLSLPTLSPHFPQFSPHTIDTLTSLSLLSSHFFPSFSHLMLSLSLTSLFLNLSPHFSPHSLP